MTDSVWNLRRVTRRRFLQATAAVASLPGIVPASALGKNGAQPPSNRIGLGMIGAGKRAAQLSQPLLGMADVQIVAACDPFWKKREALKAMIENRYATLRGGTFQGCTDYNDFRDLLARADIDAVVIATPEHWHALTAIAAAEANKDIYCEKAMTRTVAEGLALVKAVRRHHRVFQVGQQQRSDAIFQLAADMARSGELGKLYAIKVGVPNNRTGPAARTQPIPEGFDYNLWLGPAPERPYQPERIENMVWMSTYDYCIGYQAGWGCHHVDIAQWGNGAQDTGPIEVQSHGVFPAEGICDCPTSWHSEFTYANGVRLIFASENELQDGIRFEGTEGRVHVNRARIEAGPDAFKSVLKSKLPATYKPGFRDSTPEHLRNFLDCIRSRQDPVATVEVGHRTNIVCQLSDIATRLKRKLRWNPAKEQFAGDDEANGMLLRTMRPPWRV